MRKYGTTLLEADTSTLERLYSVSSRSIRRYVKYGYRALTDILIAKEQEARQKMHRRRLSANLPSHRLSFHIGRQYEINRLQYAYQTHRGVRLLVTGEEGIGKTHLLDVFLREQLHTDYAPQHLIWMYQPKTTQGIIAHLLDHLLRDAGRASLKDYAQMHRIVLILDSAENVLPDIPTLSAELGQVDILMSATQCQNRQTLQLLDDHIHLGPLSADETDAYIRHLRKADDLIVDNDIWRQTGNPGYIRAAARAQLQSDGLSVTLESVLPDVPTELAVRLLAAVFLPDEPVNVSSKILPEQFNACYRKAWQVLLRIQQRSR